MLIPIYEKYFYSKIIINYFYFITNININEHREDYS